MGKKAIAIALTPEERESLETQARCRTVQAQTVCRARILLLKADGESVDAIADKVGVNRCSVMLCLKKFKEGGIENALADAPGRGRKAEITDDDKAWIISIASQLPVDFGYSAEFWPISLLTTHINNAAKKAGKERLSTISQSRVKTILNKADIKYKKSEIDMETVGIFRALVDVIAETFQWSTGKPLKRETVFDWFYKIASYAKRKYVDQDSEEHVDQDSEKDVDNGGGEFSTQERCEMQADYFPQKSKILFTALLQNKMYFDDSVLNYADDTDDTDDKGLGKLIEAYDTDRCDFFRKLSERLNKVNSYGEYKKHQLDMNSVKLYDSKILEGVQCYLNQERYDYKVTECIYFISFVALFKRLPSNYSFIINYNKQLNEYIKNVVRSFGPNSPEGYTEMLALAEKENIFAAYELGNLYYYSLLGTKRQNIEEALKYYIKSAGLDKKGNVQQEKCNPAALFEIAFIFYNHFRILKTTIVEIDEATKVLQIDEPIKVQIGEYTGSKRKDLEKAAIRLLKKAVSLNWCPSAMNMLGVISAEFSDERRKEEGLEEPRYYYSRANKSGYSYAANNLAYLERDEVFSDSEYKEHVNQFYKYLKESADHYEAWACKTLGRFLYTGILFSKDSKKHMEDLLPKDFKNRFEAKMEGLKYLDMGSKGKNSTSALWCMVYKLVYYERKCKQEKEIDSLLRTIMSCKDEKIISFLEENSKNLTQSTRNKIIKLKKKARD